MNKVITAIVLTLLFGAQHVFAQSYYPLTQSTGSCVSISRDLSVGSKGSDVLSLQKFILSHNYPGAGSWMLTSYFGAATRAGVIDIQIDAHLPQTGIVDSATRAVISQMSCGYGYTQPSTYPTYPTQTYTNTYPWNNVQPWYTNPGTIYGNNSNTGTCGWYTLAGRNYFNDCGVYNPSGTIYPNNNQYPYNNYGGQNAPSISNVSGPTSINVNTTGTWIISINNTYNSNYSSISVDWGDTSYYGANSSATQQVYGSQSATFTHAYSQSGTYTVRFTVTNAYGSNSSTVTVTVNGSNSNANAPTITNVTGPTTLSVNTSGTWSLSVNNPYSSNYTSISVNWGDPVYGTYLAAPQQVYNSGTATFTHTYAQSGNYTITFTATNSYGSNTATYTVQVNNNNQNNGSPWIYSISPTYGHVGTQITIYGTGFNGDNVVHFGNGGLAHVTSASGNYIYYTVPSSVTPCTVQVNGSTGCPQYAQQVTPGQYQIYVTTNGVNSNSLTFTVQ